MSENTGSTLPPLSDDSIARIESAVFDEIGDEAPTHVAPPVAAGARVAHRRRRGWATGLGIAAAFVGGILIAPPLLNAVTMSSMDASSGAYAPAERGPGVAFENAPEMSAADGAASADASSGSAGGSDVTDGRDIITTAQVTLRVADVAKATDAITALAAKHDGYVEATDIGFAQGSSSDSMPVEPREAGSGWISIRVPADQLSDVVQAVGADGDVLRSSISRQDVTSTAVDLRARVDALQASVTRLTELMAKSGSVGDLIAAESALSERQAELESYEQQLKSIDEQVAMSTVSINLTEHTTATTADPAGFGDGLLAGWNGLIVSLNALVVAVGFLLPWLAVAGVVLLIVWLIRRRRRAASASK